MPNVGMWFEQFSDFDFQSKFNICPVLEDDVSPALVSGGQLQFQPKLIVCPTLEIDVKPTVSLISK